MPPSAISSINRSGTVSWPRHIPGWASTQIPPRLADQPERVRRLQGVLRDVREPSSEM